MYSCQWLEKLDMAVVLLEWSIDLKYENDSGNIKENAKVQET